MQQIAIYINEFEEGSNYFATNYVDHIKVGGEMCCEKCTFSGAINKLNEWENWQTEHNVGKSVAI